MYKYHYEEAVCTAENLNEARKQIGWTFPDGINPNNHFMVRVWQWDETDQDYIVELLQGPGNQVFHAYVDALECYKNLVKGFSDQFSKDARLDLVHYRLPKFRALHSKILFPSVPASGG